MLRTLVPARKVVVNQDGIRLIVTLTMFAIAFATATLSMLLIILFDMAPRTGIVPGKEYEAVRIAVELFALIGSGVMTVWNLSYRSVSKASNAGSTR
jgi:hypothetical protein